MRFQFYDTILSTCRAGYLTVIDIMYKSNNLLNAFNKLYYKTQNVQLTLQKLTYKSFFFGGMG